MSLMKFYSVLLLASLFVSVCVEKHIHVFLPSGGTVHSTCIQSTKWHTAGASIAPHCDIRTLRVNDVTKSLYLLCRSIS